MARKLRVEYPGAVYHVMNRGDRREPIFRDDEDRQTFLSTLGEACGKTGWRVQALCLMPNHLKTPRRRWPWLSVGRVLGEYQIPQDSAAGRRELELAREQRRAAETGMDYRRVRRGWCLGARSFRNELLAQMKERLGAEHYGAERQETVAAQAEGIVAEELRRRRWEEGDLGRRAKGDVQKLGIAARLRAETAVTVTWIAERLRMGAPG